MLSETERPSDWLRGDWMQTFTGSAFWPLDPRPEDIHSLDIAHALGMLCRYGGHTRRFYSVAEHCVLMSYAVSPENALWALLHDASEAYVVDVPRPLKHNLPDYMAAEDKVMLALCERFELSPTEPDEVRVADRRILLDEKAALLAPSPMPWDSTDRTEPLGVTVTGWPPEKAANTYLVRLQGLLRARREGSTC